jgi:hypothetical protein
MVTRIAKTTRFVAPLMAHRVRGFLRSSPVLLLTATPVQNTLAELWGLVQYVEPTGTLLGAAVAGAIGTSSLAAVACPINAEP